MFEYLSMTQSKWNFCLLTALVYGPVTNIHYLKKEEEEVEKEE